MTEIQPSNTDAILGGQSILSVNAAVLGGALGAKRKLAHELGLSDELAAKLSQTHDIFSFETVTVNDRGDIIDRQKSRLFIILKTSAVVSSLKWYMFLLAV